MQLSRGPAMAVSSGYHDLHQVLLKGLPNMAHHVLHDLDRAGLRCLQLQELFDQEAAW